jgi:hypothetical protein
VANSKSANDNESMTRKMAVESDAAKATTEASAVNSSDAMKRYRVPIYADIKCALRVTRKWTPAAMTKQRT